MKLLYSFAIAITFSQFTFAQTATPPTIGDGSIGSPYEITTLDNLYWITQNTTEWDKHYVQTTNIDATSTTSWDSGAGFSSIGNNSTQFTGSYNGKGHTVDALFINRPSDYYLGLLGYIDNAMIDSVGVTNVNISAGQYAGGLVGRVSNSTINNSYATGSVLASNSRVGGLTAVIVNGTINNSYCLVGNAANGSTINNSFWNTQVSGQTTSDGGIGKTTTEMQTLCTYVDGIDASWDFMDETANGTADYWSMNSSLNNGYPSLTWQGNTHTESCCFVNIPDANFKAALVADAAINTDGDTEISCAEAATYTGTIDVSNTGISDMTGIESFVNITELNCSQNALTGLNVTANTSLTTLDCIINSITTLDVSNNVSLISLKCSGNQLTNINVTQNTLLTLFYCDENSLTSLDVTQNTALQTLYCHINSLTTLDVTQNTLLTSLICRSNSLISLDATQNTLLSNLQCHFNSLTNLDITNNTALTKLYCYNNNIEMLDLGQNSSLTDIRVNNNILEVLNVANGNNTNVTYFNATGNANLNCIQVDDSTYSANNWTNIDAQSYFSVSACPCFAINSNTIFETVCNSYTSPSGEVWTATNVYTDTIPNGTGCDSIITIDLTVNVIDTALSINGATITVGSAIGTYQWVDCDNNNTPIAGETNQSFTASQNGNYAVIVTENGCSDTSSCINISTVGIENDDFLNNVSIYPNPTNLEFTINSEYKIETIVIIDNVGKTVKTVTTRNNTINVSDLTSGIYFLKIETDEGLINTKLIKQ